jgi:predicted MFS family arabinose efflux permease
MMSRSLEDKGESQEYSIGQANYAMILFGIGEILGCFFIGYIVDNYGSYKATWVNCGIMTLMGISTIAYAAIYKFGLLAYVMCFLWGF